MTNKNLQHKQLFLKTLKQTLSGLRYINFRVYVKYCTQEIILSPWPHYNIQRSNKLFDKITMKMSEVSESYDINHIL